MPTRTLVPSFSSISSCLCPKAGHSMAAVVPDITLGLVFGSLFKSTGTFPRTRFKDLPPRCWRLLGRIFLNSPRSLKKPVQWLTWHHQLCERMNLGAAVAISLFGCSSLINPLGNKPKYKKQYAGSGRLKRQKEPGSLMILWPETPNWAPLLITWGS